MSGTPTKCSEPNGFNLINCSLKPSFCRIMCITIFQFNKFEYNKILKFDFKLSTKQEKIVFLSILATICKLNELF